MKHRGVLKKCLPITPGVRHKVYLDGVNVGSQAVPKELVSGGRHSGGRNNQGQITCRHRGGGNKFLYREVSSLMVNERGVVRGIQWDPNREAPIALVEVMYGRPGDMYGLKDRRGALKTGDEVVVADMLSWLTSGSTEEEVSLAWEKTEVSGGPVKVDGFTDLGSVPVSKVVGSLRWRYVLAGEGMQVGDVIGCFLGGVELGANQRALRAGMPVGTTVYDIGRAGAKSQWVKTPGTRARILRQEPHGTMVRMPSGEVRWLVYGSFGTVGSVGAKDHMLEVRGKAGIRRRKGIRPTVRGCAMNPIDHPHGGRTKGGRHDVTPWAKVAKGQPTRSPKKALGLIVKTSRQVRLSSSSE